MTTKSWEEILDKSRLALEDPRIIRIVETSASPNATAERLQIKGFSTKRIKAGRWLAVLKRDYPDIYSQEIKKYQNS